MKEAIGAVVLAGLVCATTAAQETGSRTPTTGEAAPEIGRLRESIEAAEAAGKAGQTETAHAKLREGLNRCLALPGFERRTDAHDVLAELAAAADRLRDLATAHEAWQRVLSCRERTLAGDDPRLEDAWHQLGIVKDRLGQTMEARDLFAKVLAFREATLPDEHPMVNHARAAVAELECALGRFAEAEKLFDRALAIWSRQPPDDGRSVATARKQCALAKKMQGDYAGARLLEEAAETWAAANLPADDPFLQRVRQNLGVTRFELGDLQSARVMFENVLEVRERTLPPDDLQLLRTRQNLAGTLLQSGDATAALLLLERVDDVLSRKLPEDHDDLLHVRGNLAVAHAELGDLQGALPLFEQVSDAYLRKLPKGHPWRVHGLEALGLTRSRLGDDRAAGELLERRLAELSDRPPRDYQVLKARYDLLSVQSREDPRGTVEPLQELLQLCEQGLDAESPLLLGVGLLLATRRMENGEFEAARTLAERVVDTERRAHPSDSPFLRDSRRTLLWICAEAGRTEQAHRVAADLMEESRQSLALLVRAPRELGAIAQSRWGIVDAVLTLLGGYAGRPPLRTLAADALLLTESLRGLETRASRLVRRVREAGEQEELARLDRELHRAAQRVTQTVAALSADDDDERDRAADDLAAVVRDKEKLQRELAQLVRTTGGPDLALLTVEQLGARLPEGSAAVSVVGYGHAAPTAERRGPLVLEPRLMALVLRPDGVVSSVSLGSAAAVETLVARLRADAGVGDARGLRPQEEKAAAAEKSDAEHAKAALRRLVIDPIFAATGDVGSLFVSLDEALQLVPLDALPREDRTPVGATLVLHPLVSLFDLMEDEGARPGPDGTLLGFGSIDYDAAAKDAVRRVGDAIVPVVGETRSGRPDHFTALSATGAEVEAIVRSFAAAFADSEARTLTGAEAGKAELLALAHRARYLHLATHGYFAPATVRSTVDRSDADPFDLEQRVSGLSPLALTGLALSGANLPPDSIGRRAGILTAEEILALDLSNCELVTLSACDTSLGVRRAGQGFASLRAALLGAGARYVLTSLWKVGDASTKDLMVDFYRRLWNEGKDPHTALWEAKMAAREKGAAFRDWAGWVLTGSAKAR